jgi:hypothetical protein
VLVPPATASHAVHPSPYVGYPSLPWLQAPAATAVGVPISR